VLVLSTALPQTLQRLPSAASSTSHARSWASATRASALQVISSTRGSWAGSTRRNQLRLRLSARCPMLHVDPRVLTRLRELEDDLVARVDRAVDEGWFGEIEVIDLSLRLLRENRAGCGQACAVHGRAGYAWPATELNADANDLRRWAIPIGMSCSRSDWFLTGADLKERSRTGPRERWTPCARAVHRLRSRM
jgi:hypothetical protein